jgi:MYXO-CTERM domain-containing protein
VDGRVALTRGSIAIALACASSCDVDRAPGVDRAPITGGTTSAGDPAVVALGFRRVGCADTLDVVCSGTLVAPRIVLTAAHCVTDNGPLARYEVLFGAGVDDPGAVHRYVIDIAVHPAHVPGTASDDVALLLIDEAPAVEPLPMQWSPPEVAMVGEPVRVVGFGDALDAGAPGVKRTGAATITSWDAREVAIEADPGMSCRGDSGGPVLWDGPDGEVIIGVTSRGDPACRTYGVNARTDAHATDFIAPVIADLASTAAAEPRIAFDDVCAGECASDADCPAHLACDTGLPSPRCVAGVGTLGALGDACTGGDCDDCVRVAPNDEPESCRCLRACDAVEDPPPPGGCASAPGGGPAAWLLVGLAVAVLSFRSRRRTRRDPDSAVE